MKITFDIALNALAPNVAWSYKEGDYANISWGSPSVPIPTEEEVNAKMVSMQAEQDAKDAADAQALATAQAAEEAAKQSALTKLAALGLTENEVKALIG